MQESEVVVDGRKTAFSSYQRAPDSQMPRQHTHELHKVSQTKSQHGKRVRGHGVPPLTKELLATGGFWETKSQPHSRVAPCSGVVSQHTQFLLSFFIEWERA